MSYLIGEKLTVSITPEEREKAKAFAKSQGMTFQGWLGQLIRRELDHESHPQTGENR